MRPVHSCRASAFSLIELLVVIAIIALLVSLIIPGLAAARRQGRMSVCQANLQQTGRGHYAYAADYRDYIAALNGLEEDLLLYNEFHASVFPTIRDSANQALAIVKERDPSAIDLGLFGTPANNAPVINEAHSHLMLADYIGDGRPIFPSAVCPEDRARLTWQAHPYDAAAAGITLTHPWNAVNLNWFPYSSTYQLLPAGWTADRPPGNIGVAFGQGNYHNWYVYDRKPEPLCRRKLSQVAFPGQKVAISDSQQRHFGRDMYFGYADARVPVLMWDSSVSVRRTGDANRGWDRRNHRAATPSRFSYFPDPGFESPIPAGRGGIIDAGWYKWTRGGLAGIDFAGKEISTSQW